MIIEKFDVSIVGGGIVGGGVVNGSFATKALDFLLSQDFYSSIDLFLVFAATMDFLCAASNAWHTSSISTDALYS